MSKPVKQYNAVTMKNGVVKQVPTEYYKPGGKKKTVSMTIPISITGYVEEIADKECSGNKSKAYESLVLEALAHRGIYIGKEIKTDDASINE